MQPKVIHRVIHLLLLVFAGCSSSLQHTAKIRTAYTIGSADAFPEDSLTEALIRPYRTPLEASMQEVIAVSDAEATRGLPESSLGNAITDLLREYVESKTGKRPDICFLNSGGLRIELPKGNITRSMIYELMPFENELVLMELNGSQLKQLLDHIASRNGCPLSGVSMQLGADAALNPLVNGEPLHDTYIYGILTSDFLLNGGDKYTIPQPLSVKYLNLKIRDAIIDYLLTEYRAGKLFHPATDGRLY